MLTAQNLDGPDALRWWPGPPEGQIVTRRGIRDAPFANHFPDHLSEVPTDGDWDFCLWDEDSAGGGEVKSFGFREVDGGDDLAVFPGLS